MSPATHQPVLRRQVIEALAPAPDAVIVDATVGLGGHARALLEREPTLRLIGLDLDSEALAVAGAVLAPFSARVTLLEASYWNIAEILHGLGVDHISGVLFDLGVSSLQFDAPQRGFAFRHDGPLDMRFSHSGPTAADLVATAQEEELERIVRDYGEEPRARRVARAIVRAREAAPLRTTGDLHRVVLAALGRARGRIDPATRTFQALRIAVNHELDGIAPSLEQAVRALAPGGRLAVIAFHSLEDRLVKRTLRRLAGRCVCPPGSFGCTCNPERLLDLLTPRPIVPDAEETASNPRARSARLRVAARRHV
ncbi:MAG: 16S rRNA (cytosine(1402)-N(4))-methyltransferase RsmH [Thermoanaerobaculales bacterium]